MSSAADRRTRQRLDQLLVERGLAETRTRAQALVMGGHVRVGEGAAARTDRKPGDLVETTIALEVEAPPPFVSRGGLKLRAALDFFGVEPVGLVCLDVGSSTGGFTDLLLQRDASRVYAVDVGRGQLAEALRHDPRVVSMERTNARGLGPGVLPTPVDLAVVDVSFISLDKSCGRWLVASGHSAAGSWPWSSPSSRRDGGRSGTVWCAIPRSIDRPSRRLPAMRLGSA